MINKIKLVNDILKPKVKALGFTKEGIKSIAAEIADNLETNDEASEEEINAEIEKKVEAVIPSLKIAQMAISKGIQEYKDAQNIPKKETESAIGMTQGGPARDVNHDTKEKDEDHGVPSYAKQLFESLQSLKGEIASLKEEKLVNSRRDRLQSMLRDTGIFGKMAMRNFKKMVFESDGDFEDFLEGVEEDLAALNQERANNGLDKLGIVPSPKENGQPKEQEPVSDEEIKELAKSFIN